MYNVFVFVKWSAPLIMHISKRLFKVITAWLMRRRCCEISLWANLVYRDFSTISLSFSRRVSASNELWVARVLSATSCLIPVAVVAQPEESFPARDAFDYDGLLFHVSMFWSLMGYKGYRVVIKRNATIKTITMVIVEKLMEFPRVKFCTRNSNSSSMTKLVYKYTAKYRRDYQWSSRIFQSANVSHVREKSGPKKKFFLSKARSRFKKKFNTESTNPPVQSTHCKEANESNENKKRRKKKNSVENRIYRGVNQIEV